ncbi:MAG: hypothetical protein IKL33_00145 [Alphaproteobacteria bacterium]|nr:hypothetical protein [Alphaproteobacteria bacterium]
MFNFFSELKAKFVDVKNKISPYQIVLMGDFLMYVEGNITLMTLAKENIVFKVDKDVVTVLGKNLTIKSLSTNTLAISGEICSWEKV